MSTLDHVIATKFCTGVYHFIIVYLWILYKPSTRGRCNSTPFSYVPDYGLVVHPFVTGVMFFDWHERHLIMIPLMCIHMCMLAYSISWHYPTFTYLTHFVSSFLVLSFLGRGVGRVGENMHRVLQYDHWIYFAWSGEESSWTDLTHAVLLGVLSNIGQLSLM